MFAYQLQPAYRLAADLGVDVKAVSRVYQRLRGALFHLTELEAGRLKGEIELDEAYFGGRRKGKRGRGAAGKASSLASWNATGGSLPRWSSPSPPKSSWATSARTPARSRYHYTDAFRGYPSLRRYGKHHTVSHHRSLVDKRTKNHINGIEGFWSYAKHVLYNYRGISKYHFPMYLKEIEYRFNHRKENLFKRFVKTYFGYVSP